MFEDKLKHMKFMLQIHDSVFSPVSVTRSDKIKPSLILRRPKSLTLTSTRPVPLRGGSDQVKLAYTVKMLTLSMQRTVVLLFCFRLFICLCGVGYGDLQCAFLT